MMSGDGTQFREEFQRLMRALYDSLEREGELQRQLRRTKESLISVALRMQVAIKVAEEDEATIAQLQAQATESRTKEILANRMAQEAAEMVTSLNFEINLLKRKLKIAEGDRNGSPQGNQNDSVQQMSHAMADDEVDNMMGTIRPEQAVTFDRWKMDQFLFAPDTPAASEQHDKQVVQMLLNATTQDFHDTFTKPTKPTKSGIAKMRRGGTATTAAAMKGLKNAGKSGSPLKPLTSANSRGVDLKGNTMGTTLGGSDIYETIGVSFLENPEVVPNFNEIGAPREEKTFFLDRSASSMWGGGSSNKRGGGGGGGPTMGSPPKSSSKSRKNTGINSMIV